MVVKFGLEYLRLGLEFLVLIFLDIDLCIYGCRVVVNGVLRFCMGLVVRVFLNYFEVFFMINFFDNCVFSFGGFVCDI